MSANTEFAAERLQRQIMDAVYHRTMETTSPDAHKASEDVMDLVLRSPLVRQSVRRWYLASLAEQEQREN